MGASTTYDVNLRYLLQDQASGGMRSIDTAARESVASANSLTQSLGRLGAVVAGAFGIHEAKKHLVDFNSEMEQSRLTVAGMLQMNVGGEWTDNITRATDMVKRLQQESLTSTATTKEMYDMLTMIIQPLSRAGMSMESMTKTTGSMVVLSKAMGFAPQVAAIEMQEAMNGVLTNRNRFMNALLGTPEMGYGGEGGRHRFAALSEAKRASEIYRALNSNAAGKMKEAQAHTFMGEMSTFEDRLQLALGAVGLPLFKAITAEIRSWNAWIDQNGAAIADFGKRAGESLMTAFHVLKDTIGFFVAHKDAILAIATVWGGLKVAGMAGGALGGIFSEATGVQKAFGALAGAQGIGGAATGFAGLIGKISGTATALAALSVAAYAAGSWAAEKLSDRAEARAKGAFTGPQTLRDLQSLQAMQKAGPDALGLQSARTTEGMMLKWMTKSGLADSNGVDQSAFAAMLDQNPDLRDQFARSLGAHDTLRTAGGEAYAAQGISRDPEVIAQALAKYLDPIFKEYSDSLKAPDIKAKPQGPDKPKVNVTIHRIEVASDDPDRFAFRMVQTFREVARNPGQARRTLRQL